MNPTIEPILVDMDVSVEEYDFDSSSAVDPTIVRPTITVIDIEGGHRVIIEDIGSTQSFDVMDGEDGFSPIVDVFDIPNGHRLTITDAEGTNTIDILNGEDGSSFFGICGTDSDVAEKTVSISRFTSEDLIVGAELTINFTKALSILNPTLNVSNTGAFPIVLGSVADSLTEEFPKPGIGEWAEGAIIRFIFDGFHWVIERGHHASADRYGITKLNNSYFISSRDMAASSYALSSAYSMLVSIINEKHDIPAGGNAGEALIKKSNDDYDVGWAPGGSGSGVPSGGSAGDLLIKRTNTDYDMEWIAPATSVQEDNTLPITSGAVYTEIGNINALLATI